LFFAAEYRLDCVVFQPALDIPKRDTQKFAEVG
jgi:hypothetical protein